MGNDLPLAQAYELKELYLKGVRLLEQAATHRARGDLERAREDDIRASDIAKDVNTLWSIHFQDAKKRFSNDPIGLRTLSKVLPTEENIQDLGDRVRTDRELYYPEAT